jgi:hypothetical protein
MRGRGWLTFADPMNPSWSKKLESLKDLKLVYDNGFMTSRYVLLELQRDTNNWMFAVTSQSLLTPKEAKELSITAGRDFVAETSVHFLTGECVKL